MLAENVQPDGWEKSSKWSTHRAWSLGRKKDREGGCQSTIGGAGWPVAHARPSRYQPRGYPVAGANVALFFREGQPEYADHVSLPRLRKDSALRWCDFGHFAIIGGRGRGAPVSREKTGQKLP